MTPITRLGQRCQRRTPPGSRPGSRFLLVGLLLAGSTLAGCHAKHAGEQPTQPTQPTRPTRPTRPAQASPPASGPPTPLGGCGQALSGVGHSAEGPGSRQFEITRQQLEVIGSRLVEVFCRQGVWQKDVGFGVQYTKDPNRVVVLIGPGRSGLTAKQILDRLLGRG
jgi:hypothetical protein